MSETKGKPAPKKASPFPGNWARMSAAEKRAWQAANAAKQGIVVKDHGPIKPVPPPMVNVDQDGTTEETPKPESTSTPEEDTKLEEYYDSVQITIRFPGEDVREMTASEFVRRVLGGLYEAFGGQITSS